MMCGPGPYLVVAARSLMNHRFNRAPAPATILLAARFCGGRYEGRLANNQASLPIYRDRPHHAAAWADSSAAVPVRTECEGNAATRLIPKSFFQKIFAESAERLRIISRAASWHVIDSEEYARYSKNFQLEASDLKRHAQEKNLDAATLDYMRLTMTCVECHKHLREKRAKP
jgi:hypothetical protein